MAARPFRFGVVGLFAVWRDVGAARMGWKHPKIVFENGRFKAIF